MNKRKIVNPLVLLVAVSLGYAAYTHALTQLAFQNTSTITAAPNILITQPSTTTLTCPADGSTLYIASPTAIAWSVPTGGAAQQQFFGIDNTGGATDSSLSVTSTRGAGHMSF